ncbi:MAG: NAD-dependent epimerase/dehydratase family protein [Dehalococcoidia bacterium]
MRVLVTGGAGFIGSHVSRVLLQQGHQVTVVDNLCRGYRQLVHPEARFVQADLADQEAVEGALRGQDAVVHMAGFIAVGESVERPVLFAENNVVNSLRLLEGMRRTGVSRMVFSSSACVYGVPQRLPIREEDPLGVQSSPYGASKIAVESYLGTYHQLYGFDCVILRYFNCYGPNELHDPETHAIPNFIRAALERRPIPLYWKGEQVRDFIYVEDLARAHTEVLRLSGLHYFNIGSEVGSKAIDVVRAIFDILGYEVPIEDLGERPGDVPATYASSRKISEALGWRPQVSLEEGLRRTVEFYRPLGAAERA